MKHQRLALSLRQHNQGRIYMNGYILHYPLEQHWSWKLVMTLHHYYDHMLLSSLWDSMHVLLNSHSSQPRC